MDNVQVWEAIRHVVESGNEDDEVDLKSEWYDLDSRDGKAEFLKDVCAMANDLSEPGDRRYLVCGVLDVGQWPDRTDVVGYIKGVEPGDLDGINKTISQSVKIHIEPRIQVQYLEIQHPEVNRTLAVLEIRGWLKGRDARPYVIATGIGGLKKGQVFVRSLGGLSEPADRSDIQELVNCALQQQVESLQKECDELEEELLVEIDDLRGDKERLTGERDRQRDFARALCRLFHPCLDGTDLKKLRRLVRRYGMEEDFDSLIAS
ncbi:MAG: ATP-binding protein [Chloroflexi bacterium]|nr:ATP-binding protein [Chloroflexota bacterium]